MKEQESALLLELRRQLPLSESFDVVERNLTIGGRETHLYFVDGFAKDRLLLPMLIELEKITLEEMEEIPTLLEFAKYKIPHIKAEIVSVTGQVITSILSGLSALIIEGYEEAIVMDIRDFPVRSVEEPEKEKTLRGARDGLVETLVFNTAMVRRRIRDPRLVFSVISVGTVSKTDVCIGYMKGLVDEVVLEELTQKIKRLTIDTLTVGDQSLVEVLDHSRWLNPFPKIRYTERPDVVAAHLTEGKFVLMVDNSPTAIILPTGLFDFLQDVDDYYFPAITGNYFRFVRNITMLVSTFITPVYLLVDRGMMFLPNSWGFLMPQEEYPIPLFWQFMILEVAVDGLKLASLNTPSSLGMSLSVIGALLLGELSITAGWFIPQSILLMAVVALAAFSQPSVELSYASKFMRILLLIGASLLGIWGFLGVFVAELVILGFTKTITGTSYLDPLIPFHGKQLMNLLFRTRKHYSEGEKKLK